MRKNRVVAVVLAFSLLLSCLPQSEVRAVNIVDETEAEME